MCGGLSWERDPINQLVASSPAVFRASLAQRVSGPWIEQSIGYALDEAASGRAGGKLIASTIAEMPRTATQIPPPMATSNSST